MKASKLTFLELAEKILREEGIPLSPNEIWEIAQKKGGDTLVFTGGITPTSTLHTQLSTNVKKENSLFEVQQIVTVHPRKNMPNYEGIDEEIKILNLNEQNLANRRFYHWKREIQETIAKKWTKAKIGSVLREYSDNNKVKHKPFMDFIISYLQQKLSKA